MMGGVEKWWFFLFLIVVFPVNEAAGRGRGRGVPILARLIDQGVLTAGDRNQNEILYPPPLRFIPSLEEAFRVYATRHPFRRQLLGTLGVSQEKTRFTLEDFAAVPYFNNFLKVEFMKKNGETDAQVKTSSLGQTTSPLSTLKYEVDYNAAKGRDTETNVKTKTSKGKTNLHKEEKFTAENHQKVRINGQNIEEKHENFTAATTKEEIAGRTNVSRNSQRKNENIENLHHSTQNKQATTNTPEENKQNQTEGIVGERNEQSATENTQKEVEVSSKTIEIQQNEEDKNTMNKKEEIGEVEESKIETTRVRNDDNTQEEKNSNNEELSKEKLKEDTKGIENIDRRRGSVKKIRRIDEDKTRRLPKTSETDAINYEKTKSTQEINGNVQSSPEVLKDQTPNTATRVINKEKTEPLSEETLETKAIHTSTEIPEIQPNDKQPNTNQIEQLEASPPTPNPKKTEGNETDKQLQFEDNGKLKESNAHPNSAPNQTNILKIEQKPSRSGTRNVRRKSRRRYESPSTSTFEGQENKPQDNKTKRRIQPTTNTEENENQSRKVKLNIDIRPTEAVPILHRRRISRKTTTTAVPTHRRRKILRGRQNAEVKIEKLNKEHEERNGQIEEINRQQELKNRQIEEMNRQIDLKAREHDELIRQEDLKNRETEERNRQQELENRKIEELKNRENEELLRQQELKIRENEEKIRQQELRNRQIEEINRQKELENRQMELEIRQNEEKIRQQELNNREIEEINRKTEIKNREDEEMTREQELEKRTNEEINRGKELNNRQIDQINRDNGEINKDKELERRENEEILRQKELGNRQLEEINRENEEQNRQEELQIRQEEEIRRKTLSENDETKLNNTNSAPSHKNKNRRVTHVHRRKGGGQISSLTNNEETHEVPQRNTNLGSSDRNQNKKVTLVRRRKGGPQTTEIPVNEETPPPPQNSHTNPPRDASTKRIKRGKVAEGLPKYEEDGNIYSINEQQNEKSKKEGNVNTDFSKHKDTRNLDAFEEVSTIPTPLIKLQPTVEEQNSREKLETTKLEESNKENQELPSIQWLGDKIIPTKISSSENNEETILTKRRNRKITRYSRAEEITVPQKTEIETFPHATAKTEERKNSTEEDIDIKPIQDIPILKTREQNARSSTSEGTPLQRRRKIQRNKQNVRINNDETNRQTELRNRQMEEINRQQELENRKIEEINRQKELKIRENEEIIRQQELKNREDEELRRKLELKNRENEEILRQQELRNREIEEINRQKELEKRQKEEILRQQELKNREIEEMKRQKELKNRKYEEMSRQQELKNREIEEVDRKAEIKNREDEEIIRQQELEKRTNEEIIREKELNNRQIDQINRDNEEISREKELERRENEEILRQQEIRNRQLEEINRENEEQKRQTELQIRQEEEIRRKTVSENEETKLNNKNSAPSHKYQNRRVTHVHRRKGGGKISSLTNNEETHEIPQRHTNLGSSDRNQNKKATSVRRRKGGLQTTEIPENEETPPPPQNPPQNSHTNPSRDVSTRRIKRGKVTEEDGNIYTSEETVRSINEQQNEKSKKEGNVNTDSSKRKDTRNLNASEEVSTIPTPIIKLQPTVEQNSREKLETTKLEESNKENQEVPYIQRLGDKIVPTKISSSENNEETILPKRSNRKTTRYSSVEEITIPQKETFPHATAKTEERKNSTEEDIDIKPIQEIPILKTREQNGRSSTSEGTPHQRRRKIQRKKQNVRINNDEINRQTELRNRQMEEINRQQELKIRENEEIIRQQELKNREDEELRRQQELKNRENEEILRQQELRNRDIEEINRQKELENRQKEEILRQQELKNRDIEEMNRQKELENRKNEEKCRQQELKNREIEEVNRKAEIENREDEEIIRQQELEKRTNEEIIREKELNNREIDQINRDNEEINREKELERRENEEILRQQEVRNRQLEEINRENEELNRQKELQIRQEEDIRRKTVSENEETKLNITNSAPSHKNQNRRVTQVHRRKGGGKISNNNEETYEIPQRNTNLGSSDRNQNKKVTPVRRRKGGPQTTEIPENEETPPPPQNSHTNPSRDASTRRIKRGKVRRDLSKNEENGNIYTFQETVSEQQTEKSKMEEKVDIDFSKHEDTKNLNAFEEVSTIPIPLIKLQPTVEEENSREKLETTKLEELNNENQELPSIQRLGAKIMPTKISSSENNEETILPKRRNQKTTRYSSVEEITVPQKTEKDTFPHATAKTEERKNSAEEDIDIKPVQEIPILKSREQIARSSTSEGTPLQRRRKILRNKQNVRINNDEINRQTELRNRQIEESNSQLELENRKIEEMNRQKELKIRENEEIIRQQELKNREDEEIRRQQELKNRENEEMLRQQELRNREIEEINRQKELENRQKEELLREQELKNRDVEEINRRKELENRKNEEIIRQQELKKRENEEIIRQEELRNRTSEDVNRKEELSNRQIEEINREREELIRQQELKNRENEEIIREEELKNREIEEINREREVINRRKEMENRENEEVNRQKELKNREEEELRRKNVTNIAEIAKLENTRTNTKPKPSSNNQNRRVTNAQRRRGGGRKTNLQKNEDLHEIPQQTTNVGSSERNQNRKVHSRRRKGGRQTTEHPDNKETPPPPQNAHTNPSRDAYEQQRSREKVARDLLENEQKEEVHTFEEAGSSIIEQKYEGNLSMQKITKGSNDTDISNGEENGSADTIKERTKIDTLTNEEQTKQEISNEQHGGINRKNEERSKQLRLGKSLPNEGKSNENDEVDKFLSPKTHLPNNEEEKIKLETLEEISTIPSLNIKQQSSNEKDTSLQRKKEVNITTDEEIGHLETPNENAKVVIETDSVTTLPNAGINIKPSQDVRTEEKTNIKIAYTNLNPAGSDPNIRRRKGELEIRNDTKNEEKEIEIPQTVVKSQNEKETNNGNEQGTHVETNRRGRKLQEINRNPSNNINLERSTDLKFEKVKFVPERKEEIAIEEIVHLNTNEEIINIPDHKSSEGLNNKNESDSIDQREKKGFYGEEITEVFKNENLSSSNNSRTKTERSTRRRNSRRNNEDTDNLKENEKGRQEDSARKVTARERRRKGGYVVIDLQKNEEKTNPDTIQKNFESSKIQEENKRASHIQRRTGRRKPPRTTKTVTNEYITTSVSPYIKHNNMNKGTILNKEENTKLDLTGTNKTENTLVNENHEIIKIEKLVDRERAKQADIPLPYKAQERRNLDEETSTNVFSLNYPPIEESSKFHSEEEDKRNLNEGNTIVTIPQKEHKMVSPGEELERHRNDEIHANQFPINNIPNEEKPVSFIREINLSQETNTNKKANERTIDQNVTHIEERDINEKEFSGNNTEVQNNKQVLDSTQIPEEERKYFDEDKTYKSLESRNQKQTEENEELKKVPLTYKTLVAQQNKQSDKEIQITEGLKSSDEITANVFERNTDEWNINQSEEIPTLQEEIPSKRKDIKNNKYSEEDGPLRKEEQKLKLMEEDRKYLNEEIAASDKYIDLSRLPKEDRRNSNQEIVPLPYKTINFKTEAYRWIPNEEKRDDITVTHAEIPTKEDEKDQKINLHNGNKHESKNNYKTPDTKNKTDIEEKTVEDKHIQSEEDFENFDEETLKNLLSNKRIEEKHVQPDEKEEINIKTIGSENKTNIEETTLFPKKEEAKILNDDVTRIPLPYTTTVAQEVKEEFSLLKREEAGRDKEIVTHQSDDKQSISHANGQGIRKERRKEERKNVDISRNTPTEEFLIQNEESEKRPTSKLENLLIDKEHHRTQDDGKTNPVIQFPTSKQAEIKETLGNEETIEHVQRIKEEAGYKETEKTDTTTRPNSNSDISDVKSTEESFHPREENERDINVETQSKTPVISNDKSIKEGFLLREESGRNTNAGVPNRNLDILSIIPNEAGFLLRKESGRNINRGVKMQNLDTSSDKSIENDFVLREESATNIGTEIRNISNKSNEENIKTRTTGIEALSNEDNEESENKLVANIRDQEIASVQSENAKYENSNSTTVYTPTEKPIEEELLVREETGRSTNREISNIEQRIRGMRGKKRFEERENTSGNGRFEAPTVTALKQKISAPINDELLKGDARNQEESVSLKTKIIENIKEVILLSVAEKTESREEIKNLDSVFDNQNENGDQDAKVKIKINDSINKRTEESELHEQEKNTKDIESKNEETQNEHTTTFDINNGTLNEKIEEKTQPHESNSNEDTISALHNAQIEDINSSRRRNKVRGNINNLDKEQEIRNVSDSDKPNEDIISSTWNSNRSASRNRPSLEENTSRRRTEGRTALNHRGRNDARRNIGDSLSNQFATSDSQKEEINGSRRRQQERRTFNNRNTKLIDDKYSISLEENKNIPTNTQRETMSASYVINSSGLQAKEHEGTQITRTNINAPSLENTRNEETSVKNERRNLSGEDTVSSLSSENPITFHRSIGEENTTKLNASKDEDDDTDISASNIGPSGRLNTITFEETKRTIYEKESPASGEEEKRMLDVPKLEEKLSKTVPKQLTSSNIQIQKVPIAVISNNLSEKTIETTNPATLNPNKVLNSRNRGLSRNHRRKEERNLSSRTNNKNKAVSDTTQNETSGPTRERKRGRNSFKSRNREIEETAIRNYNSRSDEEDTTKHHRQRGRNNHQIEANNNSKEEENLRKSNRQRSRNYQNVENINRRNDEGGSTISNRQRGRNNNKIEDNTYSRIEIEDTTKSNRQRGRSNHQNKGSDNTRNEETISRTRTRTRNGNSNEESSTPSVQRGRNSSGIKYQPPEEIIIEISTTPKPNINLNRSANRRRRLKSRVALLVGKPTPAPEFFRVIPKHLKIPPPGVRLPRLKLNATKRSKRNIGSNWEDMFESESEYVDGDKHSQQIKISNQIEGLGGRTETNEGTSRRKTRKIDEDLNLNLEWQQGINLRNYPRKRNEELRKHGELHNDAEDKSIEDIGRIQLNRIERNKQGNKRREVRENKNRLTSRESIKGIQSEAHTMRNRNNGENRGIYLQNDNRNFEDTPSSKQVLHSEENKQGTKTKFNGHPRRENRREDNSHENIRSKDDQSKDFTIEDSGEKYHNAQPKLVKDRRREERGRHINNKVLNNKRSEQNPSYNPIESREKGDEGIDIQTIREVQNTQDSREVFADRIREARHGNINNKVFNNKRSEKNPIPVDNPIESREIIRKTSQSDEGFDFQNIRGETKNTQDSREINNQYYKNRRNSKVDGEKGINSSKRNPNHEIIQKDEISFKKNILDTRQRNFGAGVDELKTSDYKREESSIRNNRRNPHHLADSHDLMNSKNDNMFERNHEIQNDMEPSSRNINSRLKETRVNNIIKDKTNPISTKLAPIEDNPIAYGGRTNENRNNFGKKQNEENTRRNVFGRNKQGDEINQTENQFSIRRQENEISNTGENRNIEQDFILKSERKENLISDGVGKSNNRAREGYEVQKDKLIAPKRNRKLGEDRRAYSRNIHSTIEEARIRDKIQEDLTKLDNYKTNYNSQDAETPYPEENSKIEDETNYNNDDQKRENYPINIPRNHNERTITREPEVGKSLHSSAYLSNIFDQKDQTIFTFEQNTPHQQIVDYRPTLWQNTYFVPAYPIGRPPSGNVNTRLPYHQNVFETTTQTNSKVVKPTKHVNDGIMPVKVTQQNSASNFEESEGNERVSFGQKIEVSNPHAYSDQITTSHLNNKHSTTIPTSKTTARIHHRTTTESSRAVGTTENRKTITHEIEITTQGNRRKTTSPNLPIVNEVNEGIINVDEVNQSKISTTPSNEENKGKPTRNTINLTTALPRVSTTRTRTKVPTVENPRISTVALNINDETTTNQSVKTSAERETFEAKPVESRKTTVIPKFSTLRSKSTARPRTSIPKTKTTVSRRTKATTAVSRRKATQTPRIKAKENSENKRKITRPPRINRHGVENNQKIAVSAIEAENDQRVHQTPRKISDVENQDTSTQIPIIINEDENNQTPRMKTTEVEKNLKPTQHSRNHVQRTTISIPRSQITKVKNDHRKTTEHYRRTTEIPRTKTTESDNYRKSKQIQRTTSKEIKNNQRITQAPRYKSNENYLRNKVENNQRTTPWFETTETPIFERIGQTVIPKTLTTEEENFQNRGNTKITGSKQRIATESSRDEIGENNIKIETEIRRNHNAKTARTKINLGLDDEKTTVPMVRLIDTELTIETTTTSNAKLIESRHGRRTTVMPPINANEVENQRKTTTQRRKAINGKDYQQHNGRNISDSSSREKTDLVTQNIRKSKVNAYVKAEFKLNGRGHQTYNKENQSEENKLLTESVSNRPINNYRGKGKWKPEIGSPGREIIQSRNYS